MGRQKIFIGNLEPVNAAVNRGRSIIPIAKSGRVLSAEVLAPALNQKLRMRTADAETLPVRKQFFFSAQGRSENGVDERPGFRTCQMDRLVNGRVLRRLEKKELIESEPQQIPGIVIEMAGTKHSNPEVEQRQVAEDSIEKLSGEGAIR